MRCTNKKLYRKKRKRKIKLTPIAVIVLIVLMIASGFYLFSSRVSVIDFETQKYGTGICEKPLLIDELCVASEDVSSISFITEDEFHAVALFQPDSKSVLYAKDIHERIYPASTTKIMTIYLALKYGTLSDTVTISKNAVEVPLDSSRAGFKTGDQVTLEALLYSLMLPSGNDSAVAVAEYVSGSVDEFAKLMNSEAKKLGATNSNFLTPHGYHDENHYTTAYDLYLIFNQCVKYDKFLEIVSTSEYNTKVTQANGTYREVTWKQSNQYINGMRQIPDGVTIVGGKTGTTNEAGSCLILYSKNSDTPYISIIMGAETKPVLYKNMSNLISSVSK